ncbi:MAG: polysaccharide lyase family 8 super-sandwich domain-containing protein [Prolixibacteraceae bacterium]
MKNSARFALIASLIVLLFQVGKAQKAVDYPADLIQLHENVWSDILKNAPEEDNIRKIAEKLNDKGAWPDVDYASGYRIMSDFVGGVSDGHDGIAVMDYNRNGITAKKSWFNFNNRIICLGQGIYSSDVNNVTLAGFKTVEEKSIFDITLPRSGEAGKTVSITLMTL